MKDLLKSQLCHDGTRPQDGSLEEEIANKSRTIEDITTRFNNVLSDKLMYIIMH